MLARIVLTIAIVLAATSRTLAHKGHGQDGEASGLYHYLTSHGLGVLLLVVILAALLIIPRVRCPSLAKADSSREVVLTHRRGSIDACGVGNGAQRRRAAT